MWLKEISCRNIRNISETKFSVSPDINFLLGKNAQGKTSLLESIYYLATLRSFRGAKPPELLQWGENYGEISGELTQTDHDDQIWENQLAVHFARQEEKVSRKATSNGKIIRSSTQYLAQRFGQAGSRFHAIVFSPADHELVQGGPSMRRAYLDQVLAAEDLNYLQNLKRYRRVLEQRNALLKARDFGARPLLLEFDQQLIPLGAQLTFARLKWLQKLASALPHALQRIAPSQAVVRVNYASKWLFKSSEFIHNNNNLSLLSFTGQGVLPSLKDMELVFQEKLALLTNAEWQAGVTLAGPHRDDWVLFLGEQALKAHGSQGEVRSAVLALKLAEIQLFQETTGYRPLLLVDDFSSELDRSRREFLLRFLSEAEQQVFVTSTEDIEVAGKRHWIVNGKVSDSRAPKPTTPSKNAESILQ